MTQAPATPELVERLRSPEWGEFRSVSSHVLCQEAADALEAQQARIAELEGLFADVNALCTEINKRWEASQALADRYEKALKSFAVAFDAFSYDEPIIDLDQYRAMRESVCLNDFRQASLAISSSQGSKK